MDKKTDQKKQISDLSKAALVNIVKFFVDSGILKPEFLDVAIKADLANQVNSLNRRVSKIAKRLEEDKTLSKKQYRSLLNKGEKLNAMAGKKYELWKSMANVEDV